MCDAVCMILVSVALPYGPKCSREKDVRAEWMLAGGRGHLIV